MADATARDAKLIQYLNEAYGTERRLETALEAHIAMTTRDTYKKRLQQHLRETKRHAKDVERRIKKLGGQAEATSVPGPDAAGGVVQAAQTVVQKAAAAVQGPLHMVRGTGEQEKLLRNARTEYQSEAEEIATYSAIQTLAEAVGDKETAQLAKAILREERRMASFLEKLIPQLTKAVATEEIPASERNTGRRRAASSRRRTSSRSGSRSSSGSSRSGSSVASRSRSSRSSGSTRSSGSSRSSGSGRSSGASRKSGASRSSGSRSRGGSSRRSSS